LAARTFSTKGNEMTDDLSLYGISEELRALDDMLDSTGGEINDEWERQQAMFEALLTKKVDGCVGYIQKLEDLCTLAREQKKRLDAFINSKENRIENFKLYVKRCMTATNRTEFEGVLCKIDTVKGRESMQIDEGAVDRLPIEFIETKSFAKKDALKTAMKSGQTFEGVRIVRGEDSIRFGLKKESRKRKDKTDANEQSKSDTAAAN
jgi:hypothetical protein